MLDAAVSLRLPYCEPVSAMKHTSHRISEEEIRMAEKLYQMRDAAKMLLGDSYAAKMKIMGELIKRIQRTDNCDPLAAATTIAKGTKANDYEVIFVMAAAVEMIEPSTAART